MGKRLSKKLVRAALEKNKGAVYLAAKSLGCSHQAIYNYLERYSDLQLLKDSFDGLLVDIAELSLRGSMESDVAWAVKYVLGTKGRDRGYGKKQELEQSDPILLKGYVGFFPEDWDNQD